MSKMPEHSLGWQDDMSAELTYCGTTLLKRSVTLSVDGDMVPSDYPEQTCPVCGKQLRLVWDVRVEVRA